MCWPSRRWRRPTRRSGCSAPAGAGRQVRRPKGRAAAACATRDAFSHDLLHGRRLTLGRTVAPLQRHMPVGGDGMCSARGIRSAWGKPPNRQTPAQRQVPADGDPRGGPAVSAVTGAASGAHVTSSMEARRAAREVDQRSVSPVPRHSRGRRALAATRLFPAAPLDGTRSRSCAPAKLLWSHEAAGMQRDSPRPEKPPLFLPRRSGFA